MRDSDLNAIRVRCARGDLVLRDTQRLLAEVDRLRDLIEYALGEVTSDPPDLFWAEGYLKRALNPTEGDQS